MDGAMFKISEYRKWANSVLKGFDTETLPGGWKSGTTHHMVQEWRFMTVLNLISEMKFKEGCVWLDVGCFPGTMGVLLKELLPERSSLYGAGLCFSREFVSKAERVYTGLLEVELDPLNPLAQSLNHKTELELPDNSVDLCFAGEVFEHFYNPLHFISEVSRVLKVGGRLVLTTPNLSYFGNVCRLLNGKSVFEELERSHIFYHSEWRPHERVYTAEELNSLMERGKLKNRMVRYIDNHYETYQKRTLSMFLHQSFIRMFYFIPRFRPQYIGVFEKES